MTIDEKRAAIRKHCEEREECSISVFDVTECPLKGLTDKLCYNNEDDNAINEYYEILFGKEEEEAPVEDIVNHPSHYTHGGMECIDEMVLIFGVEAVKHFCVCNAWKYRKRAMYKNGQEDMDKSDWYLRKYYELEHQQGVTTLGKP